MCSGSEAALTPGSRRGSTGPSRGSARGPVGEVVGLDSSRSGHRAYPCPASSGARSSTTVRSRASVPAVAHSDISAPPPRRPAREPRPGRRPRSRRVFKAFCPTDRTAGQGGRPRSPHGGAGPRRKAGPRRGAPRGSGAAAPRASAEPSGARPALSWSTTIVTQPLEPVHAAFGLGGLADAVAAFDGHEEAGVLPGEARHTLRSRTGPGVHHFAPQRMPGRFVDLSERDMMPTPIRGTARLAGRWPSRCCRSARCPSPMRMCGAA